MSVLSPLKPAVLCNLSIILASSLLVSVALMPSAAAQEIGPHLPYKPPAQESNVTKALTKLLKSKKETPEADKADEKTLDTEKESEKESAGPMPAAPARGPQPLPTVETKRPPMLNQPPLTQVKIEEPQVDAKNPPMMNWPKLDDPANPLGFTDALTRLKKYSTLVDAKRYQEAKPGLLTLRQWLVDLTEAHIGLYKTLNQVPSARGQAELEKELALQFAQLRDRAMVETAKVYIAEKEYARAVKELTEVVKSQPRSKLGLRSYEMLQEIGFTEKLQLTQ